MFSCLPDDKRITEMNPVHKLFFFFHWIQKNNDRFELAKNHAYIIGGFINPEAIKKILGANTKKSSSEDFDKTFDMLSNIPSSQANNQPKRRRKLSRK